MCTFARVCPLTEFNQITAGSQGRVQQRRDRRLRKTSHELLRGRNLINFLLFMVGFVLSFEFPVRSKDF